MNRAGQAGYTLIELLVVIAILTGAAMLVGPRIKRGGSDGLALRKARAEIVAQLVSAREAAMLDGQLRCVAVPAATATGGCAGLHAARASILSAAPGTIRFFGDGSSDGGTVVLGVGSRRTTLSIVGPTGQIVVR